MNEKMTQGMPATIAVLGSTGSVGRQALDVAKQAGMRVELLAARSSVQLLEEQVREFSPRLCAVTDPQAAAELSLRIADTDTRVLSGEEGLLAGIAEANSEAFVNSILGKDGLLPTLAVLDRGARLALSNKESLVIAGEEVMRRAREKRCELLPVDSEHCAIFQCLQAGKPAEVKQILLTASGGPFYGYDREALSAVTREQTLAHPTWQMGAKITVDSATLMNKGFEVIEAVHLFGVAPSQIRVLIHRESIIHSAVEYIDNTVIAQMSRPDMRSCVQYAVGYPHRAPAVIPPLDLTAIGKLTFAEPDTEAFPLLALAVEAIRRGGATPAVLNAADEVAVAAFLAGELRFFEIAAVVEATLSRMSDASSVCGLDGILAADAAARCRAREEIEHRKGTL